MKISRDQLNAAVEAYCKMPTSKRDVPSPSLKRSARRSMSEFLRKYKEQEYFPSGSDLLVMIKTWLIEADYSRLTKSKHSRRMTAILRDQYYIQQDEALELTRRFAYTTPIRWSEKALRQPQLEELFARMDATLSRPANLRYYMAVCVMLFTGARITSAASAKNPTVTDDDVGFYIPRLKSKIIEDVYKSIPLDIMMPNGQAFKKIALEYMKQRRLTKRPSIYLFPGRGEGHISILAIRQYIKKLNLTFSLTPHALRHTAGTLTAERVGILEATRLLDHSSLSTTQHYIRQHGVDSKASIQKVWASPAAPTIAIPDHIVTPDLQDTLRKFQQDAARLSEIVMSLTS